MNRIWDLYIRVNDFDIELLKNNDKKKFFESLLRGSFFFSLLFGDDTFLTNFTPLCHVDVIMVVLLVYMPLFYFFHQVKHQFLQ